MKNRDIITYIVILVAILGLLILVTLCDLRKTEAEPVEPRLAGISLTGQEAALLAKIVSKEIISTSSGETFTYETAVRPNEGQETLDMAEKMRINAKMSQTDYYNLVKRVGVNQAIRELDKIIK